MIKRHLTIGLLALALAPWAGAQVTTTLAIRETSGELQQPSTDLGTFAILDYTLDTEGRVRLDHAFANSGGDGVAGWGDALDGEAASGVTARESGTFGIRLHGVSPEGKERRLFSDAGLGVGVEGNNATRIDWDAAAGTRSESLRVEIITTGLPASLKVVITGLHFGNANAMDTVVPRARISDLVNMTGYAGRLGEIIPDVDRSQLSRIPMKGLSITGGGGTETTGSFVLSQATQPDEGAVGFSLQGFTFDVVPNQ
jgi:hypothetical protein